jgi:AcrR family transcriptional regulator
MQTTENLEILALEKMINGSEAMFERRRRILREARTIIKEDGLEHLNIRELSLRAKVSTKTIYNAFGSKETVIALAIHTYFQQFMTSVEFSDAADTFVGALNRQSTSTLRDTDVLNYMKAVVSLYFSPTLHTAIRAVLTDFATRSWEPWLRIVEDRRELQPGVVLRELLLDLSSIQYAIILEWCNGTLTDEVFLRRSLSGILMLLNGACSGSAGEDVRAAFFRLQSDGDYRAELFSTARERIRHAIDAAMLARRKRQPGPVKVVL